MINFFLYKVLPNFLYLYENHLMYRFKRAWGIANLKRIKNKGKNVKVMGYSRFLDPQNITLEDNVRIGYNCFFFGKGGIFIGNGSILSRNITIYSSNHDFKDLSTLPYNENYIHKPVIIGRGVWIGMGVSITPGVHIGDGAIIGMGAVISRDIGAGEIVVGAGQRLVSKRIQNVQALIKKDSLFSIKYPNK